MGEGHIFTLENTKTSKYSFVFGCNITAGKNLISKNVGNPKLCSKREDYFSGILFWLDF